MQGQISLAVRLDTYDSKSKVLVFDIDRDDIKKAKEDAAKIQCYLKKMGIESYIEYSGKKGYHLWIFFNKYISVKLLNEFADKAAEDCNFKLSEVEVIPKYDYISETQNIIKLPLGIHPETGKRCSFLDINDISQICENEFFLIENDSSDILFKEISNKYVEAAKIIKNCAVIKEILKKAFARREMSHFNRLIILYVFNYLKEGREFIHYVMSKFDNYSYNITENHIEDAPEKPISCRKIREYMKGEEVLSSCYCNFNKNDNMYNTPLMYSDDKSYIMISIKTNIKEIIEKMIELKKEREKISKEINKLNKKLNSMFDSMEVEEIELPMGKLTKLDKNDEKGWIIRIDV